MKLSDFNNLAEAQAYSISRYLDVDGVWLSQYFSVLGVINDIKSAQASPVEIELVAGSPTTIGQVATFLVERVKSGGDFSIDPETNKGEYFRLILGELVSRSLLTPSQLSFIINSHTLLTYPYGDTTQAEFDEAKDAGQTITLNANNNHHTATISITTQPLKPVDIVVEQRFSKDGTDWTEWHEVGAFRNVDYPQRNYEASVPKSPADFRELRVVSPLTLGVHLPVYPVSEEI